jgi:ATP-dependent protease ClpP protease subunit
MIQKKLGGASGQPVDPDKNRARNEKITDKIREFIEKKTGKKVSRGKRKHA